MSSCISLQFPRASDSVKMRSESGKKKKEKHSKTAADKPQPERLFTPDEHNLVLKPESMSEEQDHLIKALNYKSVTAPMKPPPPAQLLTLVGAFLTSYGLISASRSYTTEVAARAKLEAWKSGLGAKLPKGFPDLVNIYDHWYKEHGQRTKLDETSSDENGDHATVQAKQPKKSKKDSKAKVEADVTSSSGSSSGSSSDDSGSDLESEGVVSTSKSTKKQASAPKPMKTVTSSKSSSASMSSTSSDSDADDEKEAPGAKLPSVTPTASNPINKLKRKASSSGSSSSETDSESDSSSSDEAEAPPAKKTKATPVKKQSASVAAPVPNKPSEEPAINSSSSSSGSSSSDSDDQTPANKALPTSPSDSSSSSSDSDAPAPAKPSNSTTAKINKTRAATLPDDSLKSSTDSSATLDNPSAKKTSSSDTSTSITSSSPSSPPPKLEAPSSQQVAKKRKRSASPTTSAAPEASTPEGPPTQKPTKKQPNERFSRIPADVKVDPKLASNAYIPNDYADRAFKDLSVTKGKGFTKEKNKKKRGSYRGGVIDVEGSKSIKFY